MIEIKQTADGILIPFKVYPQAGNEEIMPGKPNEPYFKVKLKAAPEDGKANMALTKFLAKLTGLAQNSIHLKLGQTSRLKTLIFLTNEGMRVLDILLTEAKMTEADIKLI